MHDPNDYDSELINWRMRVAEIVATQPIVYSGVFSDDDDWFKVTKNGGLFDHEPSLKVCNHSPDGFAWGYRGSGPAQLALALLLDATGDKELSKHFYMDYKLEVIVSLPKEVGVMWTLTNIDVIRWLKEKVK